MSNKIPLSITSLLRYTLVIVRESKLPVIPKAKLISTIVNPYDLSVAAARTCYSSKGIIEPAAVSATEKDTILRDRIAQSTREAGHLTTRQHAHFVFAIEDVSRQCIWSFLHGHPHYNSEQVSQRYVRVKEGKFFIPPLNNARAAEIYQKTLLLQQEAYDTLIALLLPKASETYYAIFPARRHKSERWDKTAQKKAFEVARYVLPLATSAYLYHTISALTLMRYHKYVEQFDTPLEQRALVNAMVEEVLRVDPDFAKDLEIPVEATSLPEQPFFSDIEWKPDCAFIEEFDQSLDGKVSKLVSSSPAPQALLGEAVRAVLAKPASVLSDRQALELVLDPHKNALLADVLGGGLFSKLSRTLQHIHFVFKKKLSHCADSQDQRHRTTPGSRPILMAQYSGTADFILPKLIEAEPQAACYYEATMEKIFAAINQLLELGESFEAAQYLLPNAFPVRFVESGDLLAFHHKWKLRTCYNAQEEIFAASVQELAQADQVLAGLSDWLRAPCYLRKLTKTTPFCPEGDRYCGLPVWNFSLADYERLI